MIAAPCANIQTATWYYAVLSDSGCLCNNLCNQCAVYCTSQAHVQSVRDFIFFMQCKSSF